MDPRTGGQSRALPLDPSPLKLRSRLTALLRSRFVVDIAHTVAARFSLLFIGLISSALVARALGPDGRGLYAAASAFGALLLQLSNLGLHSINTNTVAADRSALPRLLGNSLAASLTISSILIAGNLLAIGVGSAAPPVTGTLLTLVLLRLPIELTYFLCVSLVVGLQDIRTYNRAEIAAKVGTTAAFVLLYFLGGLNVEAAYIIDLGGVVLAIAFVAVSLRRHSSRLPRPDWRLFKAKIPYGLKAYAAAMLSFLGQKGSYLVINGTLAHQDLGFYSLAVALGDMILLVPVVIGTLLFPKLSSSQDADWRWRKTMEVAAITGGLVALATLLLIFCSPLVVHLLYGPQFIPASDLIPSLAPGIIAGAVNMILMNYFAAIGMPFAVSLVSPAIGALLNIGLNVIALPRFGVEAAGWVSSIASSLMLLYTFGFIAFRQARTRQAKPKLRLLKDTSEGAAPEGIDYAKFRAGLSLSQLSTIVFRYSDVTLVTRRLSCLARPFHTGVLLRLLTFGSITIEDELGSHVRIGPRWLLHAAFKLLQERIGSRSLLAELTRRLAELEEREDLRPRRARAAASHIVYLRTDFVFDVVAGGSLGHIAGVVNNLAPCGLTPILLSTTRIPTIDPSIETHVIEPDRHFWNIEGLPILAFNFRCLDEAERICNGRDVGAVYQRYSTNNFTGAALAAKLQVPFVLEYNGSEIWINRHWGQPLPREELAQRIENVNLRRADLIVVVSEVSKAELVERGIPPTKILVNPNGVDPSRFHPDIDGTAVRRRLGFADDDVVLGFIGTFGRWHGSEQLARAFVRILRADQATPARLLLIGDGPHAEATRRLLTDADPRGRSWHMTGRVQQDSAPTYLAAADVLVSPHVPNPDGTPFFGSPTKIFEYMAMGRGIVASALGQLADVLDDGRTALLVPPGDEAALAAGLEKLIMSRQLRESLGTNARAVVEESYTWRIHTRRIIERLAEILGETSGRVL